MVIFMVLSLFGLTALISAIIPVEAGIAIVFWIGIIITAQAFQATDTRHAPAVALGLFPALAAWGLLLVSSTLNATGIALSAPDAATRVLDSNAFAAVGLQFPGLVAISQGFMLTSLVWAASCTCLIDRKFLAAAAWMGVGALLSFFGFVHAGKFTAAGSTYDIGIATGWTWSVGYGLAALFFVLLHLNYSRSYSRCNDL